jgi:hypothetical protein
VDSHIWVVKAYGSAATEIFIPVEDELIIPIEISIDRGFPCLFISQKYLLVRLVLPWQGTTTTTSIPVETKVEVYPVQHPVRSK